jgi:hypothetical protein
MKIKNLILIVGIITMQICMMSALTITSTTSVPTEVQPGEKIELTLNIENDLSEDITSVVISLDLTSLTNPVPFAPYQSSNEYMIDEIDEGDKEKAKFDLIALPNAESGTYKIPVKVNYLLSDGTAVSGQSIGIVSAIINAKPGIELSLENSGLVKGTKGELSIKIINSGMGESKFLSVKLNRANGIKIIGSDKVYIGTIESNDFDSADFEIFVNSNSITPINLPIELTYTDSMNNQITESKILPVAVYTQEEAIKMGLTQKNNTFQIVIAVVLVLTLYIIYRRAKKKNKNKKSSSE